MKHATLNQRREAAGLSFYALAKRAGLKWHTVRAVLTGARTPQKATLERIERVLNEAEKQ